MQVFISPLSLFRLPGGGGDIFPDPQTPWETCFGLTCGFREVLKDLFFFLHDFVLKTLGWSEKRPSRKGASLKWLAIPPA